VSETSSRASANAPTAPVASAITRAIGRGFVRLRICELDDTSIATHSKPMQKDNAMERQAPATTIVALRAKWAASPVTMDRALAMIGVIRAPRLTRPPRGHRCVGWSFAAGSTRRGRDRTRTDVGGRPLDRPLPTAAVDGKGAETQGNRA